MTSATGVSVADAFVTIRPDMAKFSGSVDRSLKGSTSGLGKMGQVAGGVIGAQLVLGIASKIKASLGGAISGAISQASALEQSVGGVDSVFEKSAGKIHKWAETAHRDLGLSKNAFNELAAPLGSMLRNAGFSLDQAAVRTASLTQKGADLAATYGGSVKEAIEAINSLMRGESNPIERYGVSILQTDVNLRALAMTGKKSTTELTKQELMLARLDLLFRQTATSTGQFAREADTAAGKEERRRARLENLQATIGKRLLPVQIAWTKLQIGFYTFVESKVLPQLDRLGQAIGPKLAKAISIGGGVIDRVKGVVSQVRDIWTELSRLFQLGLEGGQIGGEFSAIQQAAFRFGSFIRETIIPAFKDAKEAVRLFVLVLRGGEVGGSFSDFQTKAIELGKRVRAMWLEDVRPALMALRDLAVNVVDTIVKYWPQISAVIKFAWDYAKARLEGFIQIGLNLIEGWANVVQFFQAVFKGDWATAWDEAKQVVENAIGILGGIIKAQFGNIPEILKGLGKDAVKALLDGISSMWDQVTNMFEGLGKSAANAFIDALNGMIRTLNGRELIPGNTKGPITWGPVTLPDMPTIPKLALGTRNWPGGAAIVGDRGPELLQLPRGSNVYSNSDTRRMLSQARRDESQHFHIEGPITVNNIENKQDVNRALGDLGYLINIEMRRRGLR